MAWSIFNNNIDKIIICVIVCSMDNNSYVFISWLSNILSNKIYLIHKKDKVYPYLNNIIFLLQNIKSNNYSNDDIKKLISNTIKLNNDTYYNIFNGVILKDADLEVASNKYISNDFIRSNTIKTKDHNKIYIPKIILVNDDYEHSLPALIIDHIFFNKGDFEIHKNNLKYSYKKIEQAAKNIHSYLAQIQKTIKEELVVNIPFPLVTLNKNLLNYYLGVSHGTTSVDLNKITGDLGEEITNTAAHEYFHYIEMLYTAIKHNNNFNDLISNIYNYRFSGDIKKQRKLESKDPLINSIKTVDDIIIDKCKRVDTFNYFIKYHNLEEDIKQILLKANYTFDLIKSNAPQLFYMKVAKLYVNKINKNHFRESKSLPLSQEDKESLIRDVASRLKQYIESADDKPTKSLYSIECKVYDVIYGKLYYQKYTEKMARILEVILVKSRKSIMPFGHELKIYEDKLKNDMNIIANIVNKDTLNSEPSDATMSELSILSAKNKLGDFRTTSRPTNIDMKI